MAFRQYVPYNHPFDDTIGNTPYEFPNYLNHVVIFDATYFTQNLLHRLQNLQFHLQIVSKLENVLNSFSPLTAAAEPSYTSSPTEPSFHDATFVPDTSLSMADISSGPASNLRSKSRLRSLLENSPNPSPPTSPFIPPTTSTAQKRAPSANQNVTLDESLNLPTISQPTDLPEATSPPSTLDKILKKTFNLP